MSSATYSLLRNSLNWAYMQVFIVYCLKDFMVFLPGISAIVKRNTVLYNELQPVKKSFKELKYGWLGQQWEKQSRDHVHLARPEGGQRIHPSQGHCRHLELTVHKSADRAADMFWVKLIVSWLGWAIPLSAEDQGARTPGGTEAGISKSYCATNSGSPKVELRFCPWLILLRYWLNWVAWPEFFSLSLLCTCTYA